MRRNLMAIMGSQQFGLVVVILLLGGILTAFAGTHVDEGRVVNNFLNPSTLLQVATDTSVFAIMAVGVTMVIISMGIDLSVGSIYALSGVAMALAFRNQHDLSAGGTAMAVLVCCGVGLACGTVNGILITGLNVHPFIITLGTMMMFRGVSFIATGGQSILTPESLTNLTKAPLGLRSDLCPVPLLVMLAVTVAGWIYLSKMVAGRRVFAVGGSVLASRYSGLRINRILVGIYAISGLTAGIAAYVAATYYGAASSGDGDGYELYVIASAAVGGASMLGGKGSAAGAMLGALLIALMRQSVRTLHFDQNYEKIIIGCAIIVAVVLDRMSSNLGARRMMKAKV